MAHVVRREETALKTELRRFDGVQRNHSIAMGVGHSHILEPHAPGSRRHLLELVHRISDVYCCIAFGLHQKGRKRAYTPLPRAPQAHKFSDKVSQGREANTRLPRAKFGPGHSLWRLREGKAEAHIYRMPNKKDAIGSAECINVNSADASGGESPQSGQGPGRGGARREAGATMGVHHE